MRIACIGWGSLIWNLNGLQVTTEWKSGGPLARIEFLRQSKNGRITLVLHEAVEWQPTSWTILDCAELKDAIQMLSRREECSSEKIGAWSPGQPQPAVLSSLDDWIADKPLDAVIWTALGAKFNNVNRAPTKEELLSYLSTLSDNKLELAKEYVEKAPIGVNTEYRRMIERILLWTRRTTE